MAMSLVSCTEQQFVNELAGDKVEMSTANEFNALVERARWGDGQAFLKLADCYRDGKGVKKDFVGMFSMVAQAEEFGGIRQMEDYLNEMPEGSDCRMIFEAIAKFENRQAEEAKMMSEQLISKGVPDGYFVQGIMAIESGDTLGGIRMMEQAASQGSSLSKLMLCIIEFQERKVPDMAKLTEIAEKMPIINILLAKTCLRHNDENMYDVQMAAHYYLKADEHACLDRRGARWLLGCHEAGQLLLSERDIQRLRILARAVPVEGPAPQQDCEYDEVVDSVVVETTE